MALDALRLIRDYRRSNPEVKNIEPLGEEGLDTHRRAVDILQRLDNANGPSASGLP